jgi:hypothetical protein
VKKKKNNINIFMKSLNEYINESLLDRLDVLEAASDNAVEGWGVIEKFLAKNYSLYGKYTIKNGVVDVMGDVRVRNENITHLTHGLFKFGTIKGGFYCPYCERLKTLEGAPEKVTGSFDCHFCTKLKSLEGAPKIVGESFDCGNCENLTSLEGAPKAVRYFDCTGCIKLTSLKGAPEKVKYNFICDYCTSLVDIKDAPKKVGGIVSYDQCDKLSSI